MIESRLTTDGAWVVCAGDCGFRLAKVMKDEEGIPRQLGLREGFVLREPEQVWAMSPRMFERYRSERSEISRRALRSRPGTLVDIRHPQRSRARVMKHADPETVFSKRLVPRTWRLRIAGSQFRHLPAVIRCPDCRRLQVIPEDILG